MASGSKTVLALKFSHIFRGLIISYTIFIIDTIYKIVKIKIEKH
jgi:hypothetical protein